MSAGIITTGTILDKIVARKLEEVAALPDEPLPGWGSCLTPRDFAGALRRADGNVALIAEIKHASPSKGVLIDSFDPVKLAKTYASNGAACISVLTDRDFFQGSVKDLQSVKSTVSLPVLRKDFIIDERQVYEAREAGADAVLLIVAILDDARLRDLHAAIRGLHMTPLVEVHTAPEMERALKISPQVIGINNRDLRTFEVDLAVTSQLAKLCPPEITLVSESGIFNVEHVESVAVAGAHAILVGESIVKAPDIAGQVRVLSGVRKL